MDAPEVMLYHCHMADGLTFTRYFTAGLKGKHPFDAIEWRVRTAEILDSKGNPVFRQEGVEAPTSWSETAVNIVASKYFHGQMGTPAREYSVKQLISRVVNAITQFGLENGYFDSENGRIFSEELAYLLVHQMFSFNSPVWFNIGAPDVKQQSSACFILGLEDDTVSIYDRLTTEAMLFKRGSGSGINFSKLREEDAPLSSGGSASGPLSFMKAFDASAGVIKSGGTTRRAAKMVILDADHPDIVDFIDCKVKEERKAQALIKSGYDGSFTGEAYRSVFFQNSNNSVRVSDEFMRAVENDEPWELISRANGKPKSTVSARELFRRIAQAAWECGDPGIQFDTTINDWHTCSNTDRIYASNPCFTGDTLVHTDKGLVSFEKLLERVKEGEHLQVYTSDITNESSPRTSVELTTPEAVMSTGFNEVVKLRFTNGMSVRCTPNHRFFTSNRGFVRADELTKDDDVETLTTPAPAIASNWDIPVSSIATDYQRKPGGSTRPVCLPEKWTEGFAHYLGWLIGDGCIANAGRSAITVYGSQEDQEAIMPIHLSLVADMQCGFEPKILVQENGTKQIKLTRRAFARFFTELGVGSGKAATKKVPWSIKQAPPEVTASFLRGLFDADGCACDLNDKGRYVGLSSRSEELLIDVQRLLTNFGITSHIYQTAARGESFTYTRKNGDSVTYGEECLTYDLRISSGSLLKFAHSIGFALPSKQARLQGFLQHEHYKTRTTTRLANREAAGVELTYNLTEPRNHSYIVNGLIVSNCSEFMFLDETSCNLASLNLMQFTSPTDMFDAKGFKAAVEVVITAMEILVGYADYPTENIAETTKRFRPLGIGYANLGALLMSRGLPYDSNEGRELAACITSIMNGVAYAQSARVAAVVGPFEGYKVNRDPMLRVIEKHRAAALRLTTGDMDTAPPWRKEAVACWNDALRLGKKYGYRNSQVGVLAPTGCLVGNSLVPTTRGLTRLNGLGNPDGVKWQPLGVGVATERGEETADQFYVNGIEPVVTVETKRGYRIQGTPTHRIKVVNPEGHLEWRRLAEIGPGDRVPLLLGGLVGSPNVVPLPPIPEQHWTRVDGGVAPASMNAELAEFIGYFMGDGSMHSRGIRMMVANTDIDVVDRLTELGQSLFGLTPSITARQGYTEMMFSSVQLTMWWDACGFCKVRPTPTHKGKGWGARIPDAILATNDEAIYAAFIRGLFESDGTVSSGYVSFTTVSEDFSRDVQAVLLALGFVTTRHIDSPSFASFGDRNKYVLRLLNVSAASAFGERIGMMGARKSQLCRDGSHPQAARYDRIPLSIDLVGRLRDASGSLPGYMQASLRQDGTVTRRAASALLERAPDRELKSALQFYYDEVATAKLGEEALTYDLSVPNGNTYIANGFVSHNTISFMMDCDTTGVEPDTALVKYKKMVGEGLIKIVNQGVPAALRNLGYSENQVQAIVRDLDERGTVEGSTILKKEHLPVFDCAITPSGGTRSISWKGHVAMMAAVQPFLSGAISKTVNMPNDATVEEVANAYMEAWKSGCKAIAIYRDGCKVSQPVSTSLKQATEGVQVGVSTTPPTLSRKQPLPKDRRSLTHKFKIGEHGGFVTVGLYDDGRPGEIFIMTSKTGSSLRGMMDAFAISVSLGLQHGVPLSEYIDKFSFMRFDPAGITDDPGLRIAKSIPDYIFRWLANNFYSDEDREALGLHGPRNHAFEKLGMAGPLTVRELSTEEAKALADSGFGDDDEPEYIDNDDSPATAISPQREDGVFCDACGGMMVATGSCYTCPACGASGGCG
jgi:ribonucleoside-diphosphate reductase alpha chain